MVCFIAINSYADGLSTLSKVSSSMGKMQKVLDNETKTYKSVLRGIKRGRIKEGQSQDEVSKRYGEPVIVIPENNMEKWVYKPAHASYFDNIKVYLFFDPDKKLAKIETFGTGIE